MTKNIKEKEREVLIDNVIIRLKNAKDLNKKYKIDTGFVYGTINGFVAYAKCLDIIEFETELFFLKYGFEVIRICNELSNEEIENYVNALFK